MSANAHQQETRPQTLAYGLADSPTGLASWRSEKFREWSDCDGDIECVYTKDELLTNISLYWHTNTIATSFGAYFLECADRMLAQDERIEVPTGFAIFPRNKVPSPRWKRRKHSWLNCAHSSDHYGPASHGAGRHRASSATWLSAALAAHALVICFRATNIVKLAGNVAGIAMNPVDC